MELFVHLPQLLGVPLIIVEVLKVDNVGQLGKPLGGHVLRGVVGGKPLDALADVHDVLQIFLGDAHHPGAFSGVLNEPLLFQAAQRVPDGGAADAQLVNQLQLRQNLSPGIDALNDVILQLLEDLIGQRRGFELIHILLLTLFRQSQGQAAGFSLSAPVPS